MSMLSAGKYVRRLVGENNFMRASITLYRSYPLEWLDEMHAPYRSKISTNKAI